MTTTTPVQEDSVDAETFQTGNILTIVGGHFVHDTFSAFITPLLPLLIEKLSLSLTLGGSLAVFMQLPSLLSVFIGYLADRVSVRYLVIVAPAVTATLITLLGLTPTYWSTAILLFAVGVSVACFHAPAPAMIGHISGRQVGKGMSLFMAGGELGRSVGPLLVGFALTQWGVEGMWRLAIFGWLATAVLYWRLRDISARRSVSGGGGLRAVLPHFGRVFAPLFGVMLFRNFLVVALSVYLTVYMVNQGYGVVEAGQVLALYELAGVGGALAGGTLSDRFGRKRIVIVATVLSSVLMYAFLSVEGLLVLPVLFLLGFTSLSVTPILQAVVQEQLPGNRATASGMFILYAFIIRAINTLIIGMIGDASSLSTAYWISIGVALLSIPMVLLLPNAPVSEN
ncbi:MAG: MFS transporter [Anaerolineaceae bacterium]|nr:MFS transporter [Anaerolineaceae bacterium]